MGLHIVVIRQSSESPLKNAWRPYCVSLCHFDGDDNSTTFTDEKEKVWAASGDGVHISADQSVFGGTSLNTDAAGDYLYSNDYDDFNMGTGAFTIDLRIRPWDQFKNYPTFITNDTDWAAGSFYVGYDWGGLGLGYVDKFIMQVYGESEGLSTDSFVNKTWYHVCIIRDGAYLKLYVDGDLQINTNIGTDCSIDLSKCGSLILFRMPWNGGQEFNGWIDEFRVLKGYADYYNAQNTPTEAYSLT